MNDYILAIQSLALGYVSIAVVRPSIEKHGFKHNATLLLVFLSFAAFSIATNHARSGLIELIVRSALLGGVPIALGSLAYWLHRKI
jgi:hypothetical protein